MLGNILIHVLHIDGTRMKYLDVSRLSRGDFLEDVFSREDPLSMIPLNSGVLERTPILKYWIRSFWKQKNLITFSAEGWFTKGQHTGGYL